MRKTFILFFSLLVLAGCGSGNNSDQSQQDNNAQGENNTEQVNDNSENNEQQSNADTDDEKNNDNSNASDNTDTVNNDHLKEFEEFDVLAQELDLDVYEGIVKSDNNGNRIILFQTKDGKKEYKSIFIKNNHRLKIVHFDDEDNLLYNAKIK